MLCVRWFSSYLGLCIYELNLFLWLSMAYHLIVYGAELNQQTQRQNTSELQDKRAQLLLFHLSVWPGKRGGEEDGWMDGGREVKSVFVLLLSWRRLTHTEARAEWLRVDTLIGGEMGHEHCCGNGPFLA